MTGKARRHYFDSNDTPRVHWAQIPDTEPEEAEVVELHPFPLGEALSTLTEKQRFVIERRYGLNGSSEHGLEEIAEAMGVHFTTVAEHEQAAIKRMREAFVDP